MLRQLSRSIIKQAASKTQQHSIKSLILSTKLQYNRYLSSTTNNNNDTIKDAEVVDDTNDMTDNVKNLFNEDNTKQQEPEQQQKISVDHKESIIDSNNIQTHKFQAETKQLLDIVTNSLYTDKEVFLRELISNASDACEKLRYMRLKNNNDDTTQQSLEIRILLDTDKKQLIIQDNGIGMNENEVRENLGTIAQSGSKKFVQSQSSNDTSSDTKNNIIGQFGVGFYSAFMVGNRVDVYTKSAIDNNSQGIYWSSDGTGEYQLSYANNVDNGTKIVIHLRDNALSEFNNEHNIRRIIEKYSNFINYPIYFQHKTIDTIGAIWLQRNVEDEIYTKFYKTALKSFDEPTYRLHYHTDAPISLHALFYFPSSNLEKFSMSRAESSVSLYSKKVLIQQKAKDILPSWLRFIRGVVDSEDLPLNVSRESNQNTALLQKINSVLTKRVIRYLDEQAKKDSNKYQQWFNEFGMFLKEGICTDYNNMNDISKTLRFETTDDEQITINDKQVYKLHSLDDYISRMSTDQKSIYYLNTANRQYGLNSPYYEQLKNKKLEVLLLYNPIDDFVVKNLNMYNNRKLISIDSSECADELNNMLTDSEKQELQDKQKEIEEQSKSLVTYIQDILKDKVESIKINTRDSSSPAVIVDFESAAIRRMMSLAENQSNNMPIRKQKMELHINHPVIQGIAKLKDNKPDIAKLIIEQVYDNACIAADLMDNPRSMLQRQNELLKHLTQQAA